MTVLHCKHCFSTAASEKSPLAGFSEFMYKNIVPACFLAPLKPTFDLTDAQTVLVSIKLSSGAQTEMLMHQDKCVPFLCIRCSCKNILIEMAFIREYNTFCTLFYVFVVN